MTMAITKRRYVVPSQKLPYKSKGKTLKTCVRCRQHKTRCDAWFTMPYPCTHCNKKNSSCTLDVTNDRPNRSSEAVERLSTEIKQLSLAVDYLLDHRQLLIKKVATDRRSPSFTLSLSLPFALSPSPSVSQIESCINTPEPQTPPPEVVSTEGPKDFVIKSNSSVQEITLSLEEAYSHFRNYETNFNKFLPIYPGEFFRSVDLTSFAHENELFFWSIILTSHLNLDKPYQYLALSDHIKQLVIEKCWLQTPRSIFTISALLILTTWPLPINHSENISDNLSVKFISLMKRLSLQFGLHKLEFIDEFSHKTKLNISNQINLNNLTRERIYKFIGINSNYWLINLGLANNNYNGFQMDYITTNTDNNSHEDKYIQFMLRISLIQSRLNENLNDLIPNGDSVSKLIYLNMFEVILNDLESSTSDPLTKLSLEYSKLQLYVYAFSDADLDFVEYKNYVRKSLRSCYLILDIFEQEFKDLVNINQLPIHYKFIIELSCLIMLRIYKSPLLESVDEYSTLKKNFNRAYRIFTHNSTKAWGILDQRFTLLLNKVNLLSDSDVVNGKLLLVSKMKNYLGSSLLYELLWYVYRKEKFNVKSTEINWSNLGVQNGDVINYVKKNHSVFV